MKQNLNWKYALLIGIITIIPSIYLVGVFSGLSPFYKLGGEIDIPLVGIIKIGVWFWYALAIILGGFYVIHICINDKLRIGGKVVWIIILFVFNLLIYPLYWYFHIWRSKSNS